MATLEDLRRIASKISLLLDNPESVKLQVKQIILVQKELRIFRKDLSATVSDINADQPGANCQPYLKLQEAIAIEQLILEGHRLKLLAVEYLLHPAAVTTQLQAEEEKRRLEQQERKKSLQAKNFPKFWHKIVIAIGFVLLAKSCFSLSDTTPNHSVGTSRVSGSGNCETPDDNASDGRRCGGRAASVREGGR